MYTYIIFSGDIRYDNRSYAVVVQLWQTADFGTICAMFMRTTYPSRYVYFRWSRDHTAVKTAVTAPVGFEIGEIQAPISSGVAKSLVLNGHLLYASPLALRSRAFRARSRGMSGASMHGTLAGHVPG